MDQKKQLCTCGKSKNLPFCDHSHEMTKVCPHSIERVGDIIPNKILLIMLPFWTPLVPPQGICHLKAFLQHHGYTVKTKDANTDKGFANVYFKYFELLRRYIPGNKQGNFFNVGHDVMRNHLIAHIHYSNEREYVELVKIIINETFFTHLDDSQVRELNKLLDIFYLRMEKYILGLLEEEKPAVLGISVLRDSIGSSMFAFRITREKYPSIMTVMGGSVFSDHLHLGSPNFEFFLEKTPYIDKIIVGEGQYLFLKLLQGELPQSHRVYTLKDIGGKALGYSSLNFPDMTDFNVGTDYPYISAQASSSCPYRCSFCNVSGFYGQYREKDPRQTVKEMTLLYKQYGIQLFFMNDALLNYAADGISEEFIKSGTALYWDGYLRVDESVCNINTTLSWRRGGFYRARLGVESGSQHVLDLIGKDITTQQIKEALYCLAHAGIKTTAYWVIGHPGETEKDFQQTLELLAETRDNIYEAECNPFIYGYTGQSNADWWKDKRVPLYPEETKDMLILQSWKVDGEPSRGEVYSRMNRFVARCKELGIPNPYSINEIFQADSRWKRLHKNAVPRLADFNVKRTYIDECKSIKQTALLEPKLQDIGDFDF